MIRFNFSVETEFMQFFYIVQVIRRMFQKNYFVKYNSIIHDEML